MKGWDEGKEDRKESLRRISEALTQSRSDLSRSWKIYRRSLLAVMGLVMVMCVGTISYLADEIAVEHPYRNLQDDEWLWSIDYEPQRKIPFSEECDWHEQSITVDTRSPLFSEIVIAESDNKVGDDNRYYRDTLSVNELILLEDDLGYDLDITLIRVDPNNSSILILSEELYNNSSITGKVWLTYSFDNEAMHVSWMPEGYQTCIFGTNHQGQDMFSKVLYGSRVSLQIGITVALLTVIIGTIVGSVSGYFGGRIDEVIMRICDVFFAIPGLILAMAVVSAIPEMTSLTIPIWFGILFPLLFLAMVFREYLTSTIMGDQLFGQGKGPLMRYRKVIYLLPLVLFCFFLWPNLIDFSDTRNWRIAASIGVIFTLGMLVLADRKFIEKASFDGAGERLGNTVDWTNPWRYLSLRTVAIFVAAVVLYEFSGSDGGGLS